MDNPYNFLDKQDRRLLLIGAVCAQWSHLEYTLATVIWRLLSLDDETGKMVTGGLDMIPRIRMAHRLAQKLSGKPTLCKAIEAVRADIQTSLLERRNTAVHGVQFVSPDKEKMLVEVHRGKNALLRSELSIKDLNQLSKDIYETSQKLFTACEKLKWDFLRKPKS
jgi:hypothetical protein